MKAGVASIDITPDEPMWLAGWAARREPASGKAMPLFAKALALEDDSGHRFVILTADLIAIPREFASAVAARAGLPRERVLLGASHTHNGPEVREDKVPFFEIPPEFAAKIPPYVTRLRGMMIAAALAALQNLVPARVEFTQATAGFARNRRPNGGPVSHDVPVLQVLRADRKPLALLFGYACHNLTLPPSFCQYHGDYAGVAQQALGSSALFLAGAGADQDPDPRGSLELTEQHGHTLASVVQQSLVKGRAVEGPLACAFEEVTLDFLPPPTRDELNADLQSNDPPRVRKAKHLLTDKMSSTSYPCPVQLISFGRDLLLVAFGGEPVVDYALRLKAEFPDRMVWVAGYCNDMFGYLPSLRIQREGGYEGGRALLWSALPASFAETTEERVIAAIRRLAAKLGIPYAAAA